MKTYVCERKVGITRTTEFERKQLASFAVNVGTKCGHGCTYCSTGAVLRMHPSFKRVGRSPFDRGYAIVDPDTPDRVAFDARRYRGQRGMIQLCTLTDAWSPEAQQYDLGRRCLKAILKEPGWSVRILTKNAAVRKDFDLIERYRDRVLVGVSIAATPQNGEVMSVVEPYASTIEDRIAVMQEAHARRLRTFAMFCPLMPFSDLDRQVRRLVKLAVRFGAEEIYTEPINGRGPGLRVTEEALREHGFDDEAWLVHAIRASTYWSLYTAQLIRAFQKSTRANQYMDRLRILLYPSALQAEPLQWIHDDDEGVVWLAKE